MDLSADENWLENYLKGTMSSIEVSAEPTVLGPFWQVLG